MSSIVPLETEYYYHVYNRANGSDNLFSNPDNYRYFLSKYEHYISPIADTFCYCLMPNHFHFLIRIKESEEIERLINQKLIEKGQPPPLTGCQTLSEAEVQNIVSNFISRQFSHLFNGYTQAYNKQIGRQGSLFNRPFKRKKIESSIYVVKLVHYIHRNPVEHGFCQNPENWNFSSYNDFVNKIEDSFILKSDVLEWFGGLGNFIHFHSSPSSVEDNLI